MSDALTNREIEDVLTSIRRLVAQEDRRSEAGRSVGVAPSGRLILTQAQRIDREAPAAVALAVTTSTPGPRLDATPGPTPGPAPDTAPEATPEATSDAADLLSAPDLRGLEATIAELEAAVSASGSVFEPDGTEAAQGTGSNVTALYATPSFVHSAAAEAQGAKPDPSAAQQPQDEATAHAATRPEPVPEPAAGDEDAEDELFETIIDEATLRVLVAQIVREELHGQLGERITLQVRKLVRSEITRVLDSKNLI